MQKAIGYIRVSTTHQAQDGVSLEAQRSKIESWCAANDYELVAVHDDSGISGKRADNRPGLEKSVTDVCKVKGALVVYSLSRMSRSVRDAIGISERLNASGADLVSLSEQIDTTSPSGRLIFNIFSSLSQFERELVSQRTKDSLTWKRQNGERLGNCPYGYTGNESGMLVKHDAEQANVSLIKELRNSGAKLKEIQGELERRGIVNRGGSCKWRLETLSVVCRA